MKARIAVGLVACGVVASFAVIYVIHARDRGTAAAVAQGLAEVLVPLCAAVVWLVRHIQMNVPEVDLQEAADALAARMWVQAKDAAKQHGLSERSVVPVHWVWSPRGLGGKKDAAVGTERARIKPLPGCSRIEASQLEQGDLDDLFEIYGGLDSGRIVLVGAPGAGKTGAMIGLLQAAIEHRQDIKDAVKRADVPVPVLLTPHDWMPDSEELDSWVVRRLTVEHAFLRASVGERTAARALVDGGHISLLVDGVDEMPESVRSAVLAKIGKQASYRVVLSSRISELERAVEVGHLAGSAALELVPITARQAASYLEVHVRDLTPEPWNTLIKYLREHKTSALATALDSPLALSLLLETYRNNSQVDELVCSQHFPDSQTIKKYLLERVLPAAYDPPDSGPYTLEQAGDWLSYLAAEMNERDLRELAWWNIPRWQLPRRMKVSIGLAGGLINGLVSALAFGVAIAIVFGPADGLAAGLTIGLVSGTAFGLAAWTAAGLAIGPKFGLAGGLTFGIEVGLAAGIISGLRFGLGFALADGFTVGLTVALAVPVTVGLTARLTSSLETTGRGKFPPQYRGLRRRNRLPLRTIVRGLVLGLATGVGVGLALGLAAGLAVGTGFGLGIGFAGGIAGGMGGGLASTLAQGLNISMPSDEPITPVDAFQGNHRLVLAIEICVGVAVGVVTGVSFGIAVWVAFGFASGIVVGLAAGLAVGVVAGIAAGATDVNAFMPACAAFVLISRDGQGPVRMMRFLEDARRRGVLRTAGPVYQFRHASLQEVLAEHQQANSPFAHSNGASRSSAIASSPSEELTEDAATNGLG